MKGNSLISALLVSAFLVVTGGCGLRQTDISVDTDAIPTSGVGELVVPAEDSEEASLGNYRISDSGIKLYYDDQKYSDDVILALEKYFLSFEHGDFDTYKSMLLPSYAEKMEAYLQENYNYGLEHSFESQCNNLKELAKGDDYTITRIRVTSLEDEAEETGTAEPTTDENYDPFAGFFESLDNIFEIDYYEAVKKECDSMDILLFSVMTKAGEEENLSISDYEIVFAEKNGNYYTFG